MDRGRRRPGVVASGYLLSVNGIVSSGLGFLFWVAAARRFTASDVGFAAAISAGVAVLAGVGVLGLNSAFLRYVPLAADGWPRLVARGYAVAIAATAVLAAVGGLVASRTSSEFARLDESRWVLVLVAASVVWTVFSLQDTVLIARHSPRIVLAENTTVGLARLALLPFWSAASAYDLVVAWIVPTVLGVVVINAYLLVARPPADRRGTREGRAGLLRYCALATFGSASTGLTASFTPVLVTALAGARENAAFFLSWSISIALQVVATSMSSPLTVSIARGGDVTAAVRRVLRHCLFVLGSAAVVALAVGPWLLQRVGSAYAPPRLLLALLLAGAVVNGAVIVLFAVPRGVGNVAPVAAIQWVSTLILLGVSAWGIRREGVIVVGWASLASQLVALAISVAAYRTLLQRHVPPRPVAP